MGKSVLKKLFLTAVALPLVFLTTIGLGHHYRVHLSNKWQNSVQLPVIFANSKSENILIFAPHCDDETLGTGGVIYRASESGIPVNVVLMTNGDGFRVAAERAMKRIKLKPREYVQFAYKRQQETLKALSILGLNQKNVVFLGYPDRGLVPMWTRCWSEQQPYASFYTKHTKSPYQNSYRPNVSYCGENVLEDVQSLLEKHKPTTLYVPHPSDAHPDHYATYCFVIAAVEQLKYSKPGTLPHLKIRTYLVHRGDWPVPKGYRPNMSMAPPAALARVDTKWESIPLPADVIKIKRQAIMAHKTQTAMMKPFLLTFARKNELFGELKTGIIPRVSNGSVVVDGKSTDWRHITPGIQDPTDDSIMRELYKGADVQSVYLCRDTNNLYVRMDFARNVSRNGTYRVGIRGMGSKPDDDRRIISIQPGKSTSPQHLVYAWRDRTIEFTIPLETLTTDHRLFLSVETLAMKSFIDKTGWRMFEMSPVPVIVKAKNSSGA